jgi:hypothetical protein
VNIDLVENIQKSYAQRHKVMVTSSEYNHVVADFIQRLHGGVFSLFRDVAHYDMNDPVKGLCALTRQIYGDMILWGNAQL